MDRAYEADAEVPSPEGPARRRGDAGTPGPGAHVEHPSEARFSPADVLHWQSRAGNAAVARVLARRSTRSLQRQPADAGVSENQGQKKEFQIRWDILEDTFLPELEKVCKNLGVNAEDLLAVMLSETNTSDGALNAHAMHPGGGAGGIIQFTNVALTELKVKDTVAQVAEKSATDQLGLVHSFLEPRKRHLTSAGRIYQATFVPGTLGTKKASTDVLVSKSAPTPEERDVYNKNSILDKGEDGEITLGDLETAAAARSGRARTLLKALRARPVPAP